MTGKKMTLPFSPLWENSPPGNISLKRGELHLWRIPLGLSPQKIALIKKTLSNDEIMRADRLLDPAKAENFIASRGSLRLILGQYLNLDPGEIQFRYAPKGKPFLKKNIPLELSFNLSHAADWAVLAITEGLEVGIDIECIDPQLDYEKLATQFFSHSERDKLMQYPPERQRRGFYRLWTAKEAKLKCFGTGFSPQNIALGHESVISSDSSKNDFELITFHLTKNYVGNLVIAGKISAFKRWHLST